MGGGGFVGGHAFNHCCLSQMRSDTFMGLKRSGVRTAQGLRQPVLCSGHFVAVTCNPYESMSTFSIFALIQGNLHLLVPYRGHTLPITERAELLTVQCSGRIQWILTMCITELLAFWIWPQSGIPQPFGNWMFQFSEFRTMDKVRNPTKYKTVIFNLGHAYSQKECENILHRM
jgi:hypothetical protein